MRKGKALAIIGCLVLIGVGGAVWAWSRPPQTDPTKLASKPSDYRTTTVMVGGTSYKLDVADTPPKQALGLGHRSSLAAGRGMIFTYKNPTSPKCFWMKDMRFAIDMVWVDSTSTVMHIEPSVNPDTYPQSFCPDGGGLYVIELPAGASQTAGLKAGDRLAIEL